jgi:glycine/sarcosine N-methyltransferase
VHEGEKTMITRDLYQDFASRYDLSSDGLDRHDPQIVEFFRTLFKRHGVHTVLDCACGTGRHLLLFHDLNCEVWGSDASDAMLEQAHQNLARFGRDVPLLKADYRHLPQHFSRKFDAVVCLGSIGYMPDEEEFLKAFRSMHAVLRKVGILILTSIITDKQWNEKPRFELVDNTDELSRVFAMDYSERSAVYHVLDIFHCQETDDLKVWSTKLTALLRDEQEHLLREAGFRKVEFYGDFDFSPYEKENSKRLITVAHK